MCCCKDDGKCIACADGAFGVVLPMVLLGMVFSLVGYYLVPSMYRAKAPQLPQEPQYHLGQVVSDLKHWEVGAVDACLHQLYIIQ